MLAQWSEPEHTHTDRYGRQSEQERHHTRGRARPVEGNGRGDRHAAGTTWELAGAYDGVGMSAHL